MKMHNKKRGFTIVELVIVIAVIAILSAVMVPTFSGVVKKARESAAKQEANNTARVVAGTCEEGTFPNVEGKDAYVVTKDGKYWCEVDANSISDPYETAKKAMPAEVLTDATALPTQAGKYYVPVQLLEEFELSGDEQAYKVYVAYVVE